MAKKKVSKVKPDRGYIFTELLTYAFKAKSDEEARDIVATRDGMDCTSTGQLLIDEKTGVEIVLEDE